MEHRRGKVVGWAERPRAGEGGEVIGAWRSTNRPWRRKRARTGVKRGAMPKEKRPAARKDQKERHNEQGAKTLRTEDRGHGTETPSSGLRRRETNLQKSKVIS